MKEDGYLHERVQEPTPEEVQYQAREYWTPNLKQAEWSLLNRKMDIEISNDMNYLDGATKWLYSNEKGVEVFAIYGIGDGTEATPLYASGGNKAKTEALKLSAYLRRIDNGTDESRRTFTGWLEAISSAKREYFADYDVNGHGRKALGLDNILSKHSESLRGRNNGGSTENSDQYQPRIESLSDREVLQLASEELKKQELNMSEAERDALRITTERLKKLHAMEAERKEAGTLYKQQQFGRDLEHNKAPVYLTPGAGAHIISMTRALRQAVSSLS